jgi:hypothetical protein
MAVLSKVPNIVARAELVVEQAPFDSKWT